MSIYEIAARGAAYAEQAARPPEPPPPIDLDRLEIRGQIAAEALNLIEYRQELARRSAQYMTAPRVKLVDEERRLVRVQNAPDEARRNPPRLLSHHWTDAYHQHHSEPVGKFVGRPSPRDLDYVLLATSGGDELLALVVGEAEPSVIVHRLMDGRTKLVTTFEV
jgi:hypothetical protein